MRRGFNKPLFLDPVRQQPGFFLLRWFIYVLEDFISGPRIGERLLITDRQQQTALDGGNLWMCWLFLSAVFIYPCLSLFTPEVTSRFFGKESRMSFESKCFFIFSNFRFLDFVVFF